MDEASREFDTALELCQSRQRRIVLAVLLESRRTLSMHDLSKFVALVEHGEQLSERSGDELGQIHLELFHVHVPKLVATGLVEFDDEREHVTPIENFDALATHLTPIVDADPALDAIPTLERDSVEPGGSNGDEDRADGEETTGGTGGDERSSSRE